MLCHRRPAKSFDEQNWEHELGGTGCLECWVFIELESSDKLISGTGKIKTGKKIEDKMK